MTDIVTRLDRTKPTTRTVRYDAPDPEHAAVKTLYVSKEHLPRDSAGEWPALITVTVTV